MKAGLTTLTTLRVKKMQNDHSLFLPLLPTAVLQAYELRVNDEFVLRGNTAIMKCLVPSFVADFVHVVAWIADNETITAEESANADPGTTHKR